jgi:ferritin
MNISELRLKTSLQEGIIDRLQEQMRMEGYASALYLSMAAWCHQQGLQGCGVFFKKQSAEEREHMLKLFDYLIDAGAEAISPEVTNIPHTFENLYALLVQFLEQEITVTESYLNLTAFCLQNKDYSTAQFLQWYLNEQREEEQTARRCIELYELIGTDNGGLYRIDKEIEKLG